jgi:hypothetical protein
VAVTVVPARTAKLPAVLNPGSVAAEAVRGAIRTTRAARPTEINDLRIFLHLVMLSEMA